MSPKLLIVDDHEVVRQGLRALFAQADGELISILCDGSSVLEEVDRNCPDAILMDVRMEPVDGLTALDQIRSSFPDLPVVMLSSYDNPTYVARAVALGATEFVLKGDSRAVLLGAVRAAIARQAPSTDGRLARTKRAMSSEMPASQNFDSPLTSREVQVLRHLALGLSNKEIAQSLSISVETVKEHVQNILRKLNAADRTDAAVRAVRMDLI